MYLDSDQQKDAINELHDTIRDAIPRAVDDADLIRKYDQLLGEKTVTLNIAVGLILTACDVMQAWDDAPSGPEFHGKVLKEFLRIVNDQPQA